MNVRRLILAFGFPLWLLTLCACDKVHKTLAALDYKQGVKKYYAGDMAGASNNFSGAIEQNTNFVEAYIYRGSIRLSCSNYDLALQDFDKALATGPREARLLTDRAAAFYGLKKYSEAVSNCTEAIQLEPNEDYAYKYRAAGREFLRDWDGALEDLNTVEKLRPDDAWVYATRAVVQYQREEYEKAVDDATRSIELSATNAYAFRIRGMARTRLKDFENALADLNEAHWLKLRDPDILAERGLSKLAKGDLKGAEEDISAAAQYSPTNAVVLAGLASMKKKTGDLEGAEVLLKKLADAAPEYTESLQYLGVVQSDRSENGPALQSLRKAIGIDPKMYYAHFRIWIIRARMGERDEATRELRASMKAREGDEGRKWELCIGHFLTGDVTESNLMAQATETAVRATDVPNQKCEALYYAGVKRLIDGDKAGAVGLFEKCVASGEDSQEEYYSAKAELEKPKKFKSAAK